MAIVGVLSFVAVGLGGANRAVADPVWNRIQASGSLVCGAIPNDPPGSWKDLRTGRWEGYEISLCRAIAVGLSKKMGRAIKPQFRDTSWKTVVLDLQSSKIEIWPGMSATPERMKALSMIGPIYRLSFCGVTSKSFSAGGTWGSLNKPGVRIANVTGTSVETVFDQFTPKATHISLPSFNDIALALQSGRADIIGADAVRCLYIHKKASNMFGQVVFPTPIQSEGSSAGVVKAANKLSSWLKVWSKNMQTSGQVTKIFTTVLKKAGLETNLLPPGLQF